MNDRQRALVEDVLLHWLGRESTHYADCWLYHAQCLAKALEESDRDD